MEKLRSTKVSEVDVSKYSDMLDDGVLARVAHAVQREIPGAAIHIDEANMVIKQDSVNFLEPKEYVFTFRLRLTSKESWPFCEKQTLIKKPIRRIETDDSESSRKNSQEREDTSSSLGSALLSINTEEG
jgi:hypothetical protein